MMKIKVVAGAIFLALAMPSHADQGKTTSLYSQLRSPTPSAGSASQDAITPMRSDMLREASMALGLRAGLAERSRQILADIEVRQINLDRQYRFAYVLTDSGVFVPPVIAEAKGSLASNAETVRITKVIYQIVRRGRLQPQPPSWRDYLAVGLNKNDPAMPSDAVMPKNPAEMALWEAYFDKGYTIGRANADDIYKENTARLDRDYVGMHRYLDLRDKGLMTSETVTSSFAAAKENSANDMSIEETTFRLTRQPEFKADTSTWKKSVQSAPAPAGKAPVQW